MNAKTKNFICIANPIKSPILNGLNPIWQAMVLIKIVIGINITGNYRYLPGFKSIILTQRIVIRSFFLLAFFVIAAARPVSALSPAFFSPQMKKDSTQKSFIQRAKSYKELDLIDIVKLVLHKKLMSTADTVARDEKLHISVLAAPGYTRSTEFVGIVSGNFAFYADKHNLNQSSMIMEVSYTQLKQAIFVVGPNIWTKDDKWNIIGDNKVTRYPQETFGLGGHTLPADGYVLDYFLVRVHETFLRHIISDLYMGVGYDLDYHFNIKELTDRTNTDYQRYGGGNRSISSGFKAEVEFDSRRNSINPKGGFFASIIYGYYYKDLGSDNNYGCLKVDLRAYIPLSKNKKHILALWNYDWFTFNGHAPYLDLPNTGWDDASSTGRGYNQARYRGKNMLDLEAEYRFPILRNGLFGGVIFANMQSFTDYPSNKFTTAVPGWGAGLRVKLNKHSGTNITFDYGFGLHKSNGLTINIGEVF